LCKLSPECTAEYKDMKAVILQELKLSATTYLEKLMRVVRPLMKHMLLMLPN